MAVYNTVTMLADCCLIVLVNCSILFPTTKRKVYTMLPGHNKDVNKTVIDLANILLFLERERPSFTMEKYLELRNKTIVTGIRALAIMYEKNVETVTNDEETVTLQLQKGEKIGYMFGSLLAPHTNVRSKTGITMALTNAARLIETMGNIVAEQSTNVY